VLLVSSFLPFPLVAAFQFPPYSADPVFRVFLQAKEGGQLKVIFVDM
jgi:hypothetical protein